MNRDRKTDKPAQADAAPEAEDAAYKIGPYNPALGEIYQRLYPEMKRPKPNQEAIAAALHAMQRLTMKMDSEISVEDTAADISQSASAPCPNCGHLNREGNRFCGLCGASIKADTKTWLAADLRTAANESSASEISNAEVAGDAIFTADTPSDLTSDLPSDPPEANDSSVLPFAPQSSDGKSSALPAPQSPASGAHHYHHHYHHHFFPGSTETAAASSRPTAPDSVREADRLRIAAAAKGEPITRSEAAVRRLTQEWVLACNTRQLDELIDLYSPDALVLRSNLPLLRGAAQVREFFFSALESGLGEVALEPVRVDVIGDVAHEVGRYSALVPGNTGKRREERGKYLWVFAKQPGGEWKLVSECWSSDLTLTTAESDGTRAMTPPTSKLPKK